MSTYRYTAEDGWDSVTFELSDEVAESYNKTMRNAMRSSAEDVKIANMVYHIFWKLLILKTGKYRDKAPPVLQLTKVE